MADRDPMTRAAPPGERALTEARGAETDWVRLQRVAEQFVASTRDYLFIRPEDRLLILRPNRTHHLNRTACDLLHRLYAQQRVDVAALAGEVAAEYRVAPERVAHDLDELVQTLSALLKDDLCHAPRVKMTPFGSHEIKYPVLSEIALTYRCQNRCGFCYADSPARGRRAEMTTGEVKVCLDRIRREAKVPTVSFTGGEPTLRRDLPELIGYAKRELVMRANLITNGIKCHREGYCAELAERGLDSAQVSLEGPDAETHDRVTRHPGSFAKTVQGVRNLKAAGIHTHTNTTICSDNAGRLLDLVDFLADELQAEYFSMNMVIRTGTAAVEGETIDYTRIGDLAVALRQRAAERGLRMVWYSPVPYCLFNPIVAGIGSNSCAAASGLLSVDPRGDVLPCSSFEHGVGSLLHEGFEPVWNQRAARYWRNKEYLPPVCRNCDLKRICCGACPLYWDEKGSFDELPGAAAGRHAWRQLVWRAKRSLLGRVRGVNLGRQ